ncbi:MAG: DUF2244 domain-containing protein [Thermaurantiacus sp.]
MDLGKQPPRRGPGGGNGAPVLDLVMTPNRSGSTRLAWWAVAGVATLFGLLGLRFLLLGAWPILPFMAIDVVLLWWALGQARRNREQERLVVAPAGVWLERIAPDGTRALNQMDPIAARLLVERSDTGAIALWLHDGRTRVELGCCLGQAERAEVATEIRSALARVRN